MVQRSPSSAVTMRFCITWGMIIAITAAFIGRCKSIPASSYCTTSRCRISSWELRQAGRMSVYFDELEACHGKRERQFAEEQMNRGAAPPHEGAPLEFPLNARIARSAEGVIVHSEWARERIAAVAAGVPVTAVKHHITQWAAETPMPERAQNGKVT